MHGHHVPYVLWLDSNQHVYTHLDVESRRTPSCDHFNCGVRWPQRQRQACGPPGLSKNRKPEHLTRFLPLVDRVWHAHTHTHARTQAFCFTRRRTKVSLEAPFAPWLRSLAATLPFARQAILCGILWHPILTSKEKSVWMVLADSPAMAQDARLP